jgi:hypothetical protein
MRILCPIVQSFVLPMFDRQTHLLTSRAIARKLINDNDTWRIAQAVLTANSIRLAFSRESGNASAMGNMLKLIWWAVIGLFRSRTSLEAEILTLRHQLNVLRRKSPKRLAFSNFDRLVFALGRMVCLRPK